MNGYLKFKKKMQQRVEILRETIEGLEQLDLVENVAVSRWTEHLRQVEASLEDSMLRIAVVGSVKSGKSTLINALLGRDLLKRGAGIITAFITRVRTNGAPGGWVELKPWSQILDELNGTLQMLPILQEDRAEDLFVDIRRGEDRERLKTLAERMRTEWQQVQGQLDPNFILLNGYLDGYAGLHANMGETVNRLIFDEHTLGQHQLYVGNEGQAAYVRDMEIHYPVSWLGEKIEIADCQGNDSPNPLHFALLQQYLLGCHFIFYVINSRTGLREADFKLLDFIKTLRMFPHTLFVLNTDLDAHPDQEDLDRLIERVRTELSWVAPNPQLYAFSALYHLADQLGEALPERERRRLELWREDQSLAERTEAGFSSVREHLVRRIANQRVRVVLGSGLSRLNLVAGSILDTSRVQKRFMDQNLGSLKKSTGLLKRKQKAFQDILRTLENAIAGIRESLRCELDEVVERFFDLRDGPIIKETLAMVENYPVDSRYHKDLGDYRQLLRQLHLFYLEFRQSLSRYLVEKVNLRMIEFAKEEEAFLQERLSQSSHAFWSLFATALDDYRRDMAQYRIVLRTAVEIKECDWSFMEDITPPSFSAFVDRGAVGRGVLLMKFGIGRFTRFLTRLKDRVGKRDMLAEMEPRGDETIQEAISLVKSETKSELLYAFADYRKSFKLGYLYRMLDEGSRHLLEEFRTRAEMAQLDFSGLLKQSQAEGEGRESMIEVLTRTSRIAEAMAEELDGLTCAVDLEWLPNEEEAIPEVRKPSGSTAFA
jgi:hypothetical protein